MNSWFIEALSFTNDSASYVLYFLILVHSSSDHRNRSIMLNRENPVIELCCPFEICGDYCKNNVNIRSISKEQ